MKAVVGETKTDIVQKEVHIIHDYPKDFYGDELRVIVMGYIRAEKNYDSLGMLRY